MLPEQESLFDELYQEHFQTFFHAALAILTDSARAQDVVQDTFHEAILHIDTLMTHENPGGWLYKTLKNKIRNSECERQRYLLRFLSMDTDIPEDSTDPALIVETDEFRENEASILAKIKSVLTPEEFHLLTRLVLDGRCHLEVAKELNITVYACQKRLERIRTKLYRHFPEWRKKK